ncbi:MAG: hypothetical protein JNM52_00640 [Betaproteobacteria bacterium]|nr:hypothetical protein [Betaproteobacteria bacterium]
MSQPHQTQENNPSSPVKMAISVSVGAVGLVVAIIMLAYFAVGTHTIGSNEANNPEAVKERIAPVTTLAVESKAPQAK